MTRKWNIDIDQLNGNYDTRNETIYNTEVLISNFCGYNDTYILVRGDNTIARKRTQEAFKNCAPFIKCITKNDGTTIDYAKDLDLVMPVYNLLDYSSNYSDATGSLWFYAKDKGTNFNTDIVNTKAFKSFQYKAKLLENTVAQPAKNNSNGVLKNETMLYL